ncbi:hypothetical protein ONZ45_g4728 [Pleurotus djamor]|nr:hypothetical protein ONZ45_g4728 [Pleurotus djamor]
MVLHNYSLFPSIIGGKESSLQYLQSSEHRLDLLTAFKSRGYNERRARGFGKLKAATEKALGNRVNDMLYVEGLGMNPACQGRGYGGALLDAVTSMADASSHASYLYSSNVAANTKFYMSHGFLPVAEIFAGDDDPEWDNPPVAVQLMVREVPEGRLETKT